ncbi:MAG: biopolymer transporter ExbD [Thioalkalivibrio sp.]|nr:biopolymer transporter ExbD [Thioalkalivibrio sp.]
MAMIVRRTRRRASIGLTPLIDVVFILLVFFMLASSFVDWRAIELAAPSAGTSGTGGSVEGALLVEVRADGLRFAGEALPLSTIAERVAARLAAAPDTVVLVKPAPGVTLQSSVTVLDRLAETGAVNLSLVRDAQP